MRLTQKIIKASNEPKACFSLCDGDEVKATAIDYALREQGILLSAIRPPTVAPGTSRLRLTVTAAHTEEQILYTAEAMKRVWQTTK